MSQTWARRNLHLFHGKLQRPSSHLRSLQTKGNSPFFPPRQLYLQIQIIKGIQQWQKYDPPPRKGSSGLLEFDSGAQKVLPAGDYVGEGRFCVDKVAVQQNCGHLSEYLRVGISEGNG